ncbi:hypothetical protein CBD41_04465 [bacterium TMED181]|nr:hypothetical protein [Planctomycetota bacterium]OUW45067.1 MAG: hypothetical protein CBD41_04465 [bacterium TMED181]
MLNHLKRSLGIFLAVATGVLLFAASVEAQTTLGGDVKPKRALRLTISGDLSLTFVDRSASFARAALGDGAGGEASPLAGAWDPAVRDGFFIDPIFHLDLEAEVSEGVEASIRIGTPFDAQENLRNGRPPLGIQEAKITWEGAMNPDLDLELGVVRYTLDIAGNGNPMFLSLGNSESAFDNPGAGVLDSGMPQSSSAGRVDSLNPAGAVGNLDLGENSLDVLMFDLSSLNDESLFGFVYSLPLDTGDYQGDMSITWINAKNDGGSDLFTLGGGASVTGADGLKIYGEVYIQNGDYGSGTGSGTIDQDAHAFLAGVRYDLPDVEDDSAPWVDVSFWDYSGDSDSTDNSNGNFVSYEFNNDTIVLEDSYYGLDLDTNYRAFKVKGGMNLSPEWSIQGTFAYFTLNSNAGGFASNPSNNSKKLGDEFDVRATYRATDFLTFHLNAGTLQNAKALGVGSGMEVVTLTSEVRF